MREYLAVVDARLQDVVDYSLLVVHRMWVYATLGLLKCNVKEHRLVRFHGNLQVFPQGWNALVCIHLPLLQAEG